MEDFAQRLQRLIAHKRPLNEEDLAEKIGVHKNSVRAYIRGELVPNAEVVLKIGDYFGCSMDWLLRGMTFEQFKYEFFAAGGGDTDADFSSELRELLPHGEVIEERRADYRDKQIKKIIFLARQLNPDDRGKLVQMIKSVFKLGVAQPEVWSQN